MPCIFLVLSLPSILAGDRSFLIPLIVIWAVFCLFIRKAGGRKSIEKHTGKLYSKRQKQLIPGERELEIEGDFLVERSQHVETKVGFEVVEKIGLSPDYAFIYIGPLRAFIIPKSKVTEGDYEGFVVEAKRRIEERDGPEEGREKTKSRQIIIDPRELHYEDLNFGKHSGLGIASFVISLGVIGLDVLTILAGLIVGIILPGIFSDESRFLAILASVIFLGGAVAFIGFFLGISGVSQKNRKKVFAILGIIFNAIILLSLAGLCAAAAFS